MKTILTIILALVAMASITSCNSKTNYYSAINLEDNTKFEITGHEEYLYYQEGDTVWVNSKQEITPIDSNTMKAVIIKPLTAN